MFSSKKNQRPPTPEEIAYREARKLAGKRSGFLTHLTVWGATVLFLMFTAGFSGAIVVALGWGIALAVHGYSAMIGPRLRQRWIDEEVSRRLQLQVTTERRSLEGRHARSMEQLSASIAHEIRNPITAAKSLVQQINEDPTAPENQEYAQVAVDELDRVERSIAHLLRYAREEEVRLQEIDLADIVDSAVDTFRDRLSRSSVRVEQDLAPGSVLQGDPEKLRRIIINLVSNSLDALEGAGLDAPYVSITTGQNLAGTELWLRVRDNGPGIPAERLSKIFSPFHTSKSDGTGLGLAITRKSVQAHGGSIEVESTEGAGTEFLLTFPAAATPRSRPAS